MRFGITQLVAFMGFLLVVGCGEQNGSCVPADDGSNAPVMSEAMLKALQADDSESLKRLLEHGESPDAVERRGRSHALHFAVGPEEGRCLRVLLDAGADVNARGERGVTPLARAVVSGRVDQTRLLLEHGATIREVAEDGYSALFMAALSGHVSVCELLLESGADPLRLLESGSTALHAAVTAMEVHDEEGRVLQLFLEEIDSDTELDIEGRPSFTPLMRAATEGNSRGVRLLLEAGASATYESSSGHTALYWAVFGDSPDVVRLLLQQGVDPNRRYNREQTVLHHAARLMSVPVIEALIEGGADPRARDEDANTPLHSAASAKDGSYPLEQHRRVIQLLLDAGTDPKMTNREGKTPAEVASRSGLEVLLSPDSGK